MARRGSILLGALLGMACVAIVFCAVVVAWPAQALVTPAPPTYVVLPTPSPSALPLVTAAPSSTTPQGDQPAATPTQSSTTPQGDQPAATPSPSSSPS
jgi:hypothetical protein